jgi:molecular chaperone DnaJ
MVIIEEKKHAHFVRDRNNIIYNLNITFPQAALGDSVEVPTLTGTDNVRIEPGTQNGTKLRIRDKGIPYLNSSGRGDQYVILHISIPTRLSSKEKELIETLAELDNFSPSQLNNKEKDKNIFEKIKDAFV